MTTRGQGPWSRWRISGLLAVALLAAACGGPATATPAPTPTATSGPTAVALIGRLGEWPIVSRAGGELGTFTATRESDVATRLSIDVAPSGGPRPWGIYDQEACSAPRTDHDAPFQFADIENGHRDELVESAAYLGFEANLYVLVFGPDGGSVDGCLDLGPGVEAAPPPSAEAACGDGGAAPSAATDGAALAISRDHLSNSDIYAVGLDGGPGTRLTRALGVDMKPSWSPAGDQIAFRSSRDGQDEIYVMDADGGCQHNLTDNGVDDRSPAWSPVGCQIAFDHFFSPRFQDIAVISSTGGELERITTKSGEYPNWSPDGRRIAFASARDGDYDIYVINADGTGERQLIDAPGYQMYPAWSADGDRIAYESGPDSIDGLQIHVMDADGGNDRAITTDTETNRFPAWSADGKLAWSRSGTITLIDEPGGEPRPIGAGQFPAWRSWVAGAPAPC